MKKLINKKTILFGLVVAVVVGAIGGGWRLYSALDSSDAAGQPLIATLSEVSGQVVVKLTSSDPDVQAQNGQEIKIGGVVNTGPDGRLRLDMSNETIIRVAENSTFVLLDMRNTDTGSLIKLRMSFGRVWLILKGGSAEVDTPAGVASVRGSYMSVFYNPNGEVEVTCLEGSCVLQTPTGEVQMVAGQTAVVQNFDLPPVQGVMNDTQVQEWLQVNPEATVIILAVTATVNAVRSDPNSHVQMPALACLDTNTCETYCYPVGWDKDSGTPPPPESIPQDCRDAGQALIDQGVDAEAFFNCVYIGGDPQICADNSVNR